MKIKPVSLGPYQLKSPLCQAALSGYSDYPMRVIAARLGAAYTLCEVMIDRLINQTRQGKQLSMMYCHPDEYPVGGQLMGSEPEEFGPAAQKLVDAGFHVIDINFGCPVKKVMSRCRGGYHLGQPEVALEIISRVRDTVPDSIPVTLKMRRGIDDSSASEENFFRIFEGAYARGLAAITVHGRTVEQKYVGSSKWEFLRQVKQQAGDRIVVGSGDLFSPQACLDMLRVTGVDGVSIARGAIGNPWIFQQTERLLRGESITPPDVHEQRTVIAEHFELAREFYGEKKVCNTMRKFGIFYSELHPQRKAVRDAFIAVKTSDQWLNVLEQWYQNNAPGCFPPVEEPNPLSLEAVAAASGEAH
ncbi:tRNA-dihydrouridine synthase family protein [Gimesia chilikensis]|uniref:tRNA dihydrouridine synthase n=1 Tax=Gimesia chilikensis TaxID=2605989 RepID=UPI0011EBE76F|nr:tRNA-dihydrouridine synthase [Gimesia chilikensis]KAA0141056.1 tRNA-dihydrouridine synthase family protein [Gimesia chilikensis]